MSNLERINPQVPQLLTSLEVDDFLPSLGGWSQKLGQRILVAGVGSVLALAIWPWRETVRASGVIRPAGENSVVQSQFDGTLANVWVKENQQVRRGERLAELDRRSLEGEREKLKSELTQSLAQQQDSYMQENELRQQKDSALSLNQAQLRSAQSDLDSAHSTVRYRQLELKRYSSLLSTGAVSHTVVDEKQAQLNLAQNELRKAQQALLEKQARGSAELARLNQEKSQNVSQEREHTKQLDQIRARLNDVQRALANSVIKAPREGIIVLNNLRHPQQVIRGGDVLAQIVPLNGELEVKVNVPSSDVSNIRSKQIAHLRVAGCPYPEFGVMPAKVLTISADSMQANNQQQKATFLISLKPESNRMQAGRRICTLRHGMDVQADIVTRNTTVMGFVLTKMRLITGA